jgi:hypothetical protein
MSVYVVDALSGAAGAAGAWAFSQLININKRFKKIHDRTTLLELKHG